MWARYAELVLAGWLGISPFVMNHGQSTWLWVHDLLLALLIASLALLSFRRPFVRAHLLLIPVAAWLTGFGWWHAHGYATGAPAAFQNWIVVGLLLLLFAIIPSHASTPPGRSSLQSRHDL
jgi:hypothetical protein